MAAKPQFPDEQTADGNFDRQPDSFRDWISDDGSSRFPNLQGYLLDLFQQPGIAETVNLDHIKRHYYYTHDDINPTRIVPIGPALDLSRPSGRAHSFPFGS